MYCFLFFVCFFFNKIKFLGGLELEHYWSSEKEGKKKAMYIWIIYYYKVSIRY